MFPLESSSEKEAPHQREKERTCSFETSGHLELKEREKEKRPKALVLLSGGLDSMLAAKLVADQGIEVEAVHFANPFSVHDGRFAVGFCEEMGVKLHTVILGQELLDVVADPPHGYGSQMNPCIDCRILELKKAKELAEKHGADFLVTGEVLDERPFSQKMDLMMLIEKEAGLKGKILRPLSAKLLPESEPEKKGMISRENLYAIRGRQRLPQIQLAKQLGISGYPGPSGGCLLTDPRFSERIKEHMERERRLSILDVELLKIGRHFRVGQAKVIVGRNKEENERLLSIAERDDLDRMEVIGYVGPLTLVAGKIDFESMCRTGAITARYSDAPRNAKVKVRYTSEKGERVFEVMALEDEELKGFRI